ncbi:hypothetical protein DLAC_04236 [Tieghemostelium lacteum]|uniref:Uncharacterized protein n=1 Tax=Tieghemostelium lacteum TaxID=361077 RepID=A0A151ZSM7_TIELA|nr:hypothetical protein DLAC_04236 [Tieghemostelium lacteum]|eukprot:KYQ96916.1 hypothetical protein DLAC_04236 [Tieghemostelium lacteum]
MTVPTPSNLKLKVLKNRLDIISIKENELKASLDVGVCDSIRDLKSRIRFSVNDDNDNSQEIDVYSLDFITHDYETYLTGSFTIPIKAKFKFSISVSNKGGYYILRMDIEHKDGEFKLTHLHGSGRKFL